MDQGWPGLLAREDAMESSHTILLYRFSLLDLTIGAS